MQGVGKMVGFGVFWGGYSGDSGTLRLSGGVSFAADWRFCFLET